MRMLAAAVSILIGCSTSESRLELAPSAAPTTTHATSALDGAWGAVLGGQLHLALTIKGSDAVLDSIDQGAKLQVDHLSLKGTAVHFEIAKVHGSYDGTLAGDRIDGTWTQDGPPQPLVFARGTAPPELTQAKAPGSSPLDAPIDVIVPKPPAALRADGSTHFVYELHVVNFSHVIVTLNGLDVLAGERTVATFGRAALAKMIAGPGAIPGKDDAEIAPGALAVVYVWVTVDGAAPAKLDHRITVKAGADERTVSGPSLAVASTPPLVVSPPLVGGGWVASNGPSNTSSHRRALIPIGGRAQIAQRFAIDWVKVGEDGKTFSGDVANNASYHAYGERALAVAAGTVIEVKDGIAENVPRKPPAVPITLDTVAGNHVVIDLGNGAFGMWAHLQPGSLKVKVGDRVKAGQELGLVGNTGNSTEPHLHFQISDAGSPLGSEGVPYAFARFSAHHKHEPPQDRKNELPSESELVTFP